MCCGSSCRSCLREAALGGRRYLSRQGRISHATPSDEVLNEGQTTLIQINTYTRVPVANVASTFYGVLLLTQSSS